MPPLTPSSPNDAPDPIESHNGKPNLVGLQLLGKLQTSLETESIINFFAHEVQRLVHFDGLKFLSPAGHSHLQGKQSKCQCTYRLKLGKRLLGELFFYRLNDFSEEDRRMLEYLLSVLLYPLRNANLYEQALKNALRDPLTGVNNRSAMGKILQREIDLARRYKTTLSVLMLDIDNFKRINDRYGHVMGDHALKHVVAVIEDNTRRSDILFRFGGEEFLLILSNTALPGACLLAERIRRNIEKTLFQNNGKSIQLTVSVGAATLEQSDHDQAIFQRADEAMYCAKRQGKNRVHAAESIVNAE